MKIKHNNSEIKKQIPNEKRIPMAASLLISVPILEISQVYHKPIKKSKIDYEGISQYQKFSKKFIETPWSSLKRNIKNKA